jgi:hypothetical protein
MNETLKLNKSKLNFLCNLEHFFSFSLLFNRKVTKQLEHE